MPFLTSSTAPAATATDASPAGAFRRGLRGVSSTVAALLRLLVRIPVAIGRLGVVLGRILERLSSTVDRSSTIAMDLLDDAKERATELQLEAPQLVTASSRRRDRRRRAGRYVLFSALGVAIGAGVAWVWRSRQQATESDDLFVEQVDGESVINVAAAER